MAIEVKAKIEQISKQVYEVRAVVKGKLYTRRFIGYSKKDTLKLFGKWISTQL